MNPVASSSAAASSTVCNPWFSAAVVISCRISERNKARFSKDGGLSFILKHLRKTTEIAFQLGPKSLRLRVYFGSEVAQPAGLADQVVGDCTYPPLP